MKTGTRFTYGQHQERSSSIDPVSSTAAVSSCHIACFRSQILQEDPSHFCSKIILPKEHSRTILFHVSISIPIPADETNPERKADSVTARRK